MTSADVANVNSTNNELEQFRNDARIMELKVYRKEADVRLAEEEKLLRTELQDMNNMIVDKLRNEELMEAARLPLDVDHHEEIKALEALLKMEQSKTEKLRSETETMEFQIVNVESELEKTNAKLSTVKEATGWDVDMVMAREGPANLNEFLEKKKVLAALHEQQQTEKDLSDRLTNEIEELVAFIQEQEDLDEKIAAAQEIFAAEQEKFNSLCAEERSLELLAKKKERLLSVPKKDEYKEIRQLEREKRAAHNALLTLREGGGGHSNTLVSVESRLRQLEGKLETINIFLRQHFSNAESLPPMEGVSEGSDEVSVAKFNNLCRQVTVKRSMLLEQDDKLERHDSTIEQVQLKINVLRGALRSNNMMSQLYNQEKEKDMNTLIAYLENLNTECEEVEAKTIEENHNLRRQLRR